MANLGEETLAPPEMAEEEDEQRVSDENENENESDDLSHEWETMARAWLCSFPEAKAVSMAEVEAWIDSNHDSLPRGIQSMPRSDLSLRLISIQNMRLSSQANEVEEQEEEATQVDTPHARFQRTDQWRPVYSWLESLDRDEVVKSKDISDWLTENPGIQEHLFSRHSRYHLMHYIKKCHMKILKRRERKKGFQQSEKPAALKVNKDVAMKQPAALPSIGISPVNLPKDSEVYMAKRKEAFQKYEILVELEKLLSSAFMLQEMSK